MKIIHLLRKEIKGDFPGGPGVGTLPFHCRGSGFDSWSGNQDPAACHTVWPHTHKKKGCGFKHNKLFVLKAYHSVKKFWR